MKISYFYHGKISEFQNEEKIREIRVTSLIICFSAFLWLSVHYLMTFSRKESKIVQFGGIARIISSIACYNHRHFATKSFREDMNNYHGKIREFRFEIPVGTLYITIQICLKILQFSSSIHVLYQYIAISSFSWKVLIFVQFNVSSLLINSTKCTFVVQSLPILKKCQQYRCWFVSGLFAKNITKSYFAMIYYMYYHI